MTEWQWKIIMALVRYVLSRHNSFIKFREEDENMLHDAMLNEDLPK